MRAVVGVSSGNDAGPLLVCAAKLGLLFSFVKAEQNAYGTDLDLCSRHWDLHARAAAYYLCCFHGLYISNLVM